MNIMETRSITIDSSEYPDLLKEIQDPPERIWYRGNIGLLKRRCVSVVGSRKSTLAGERAAEALSERLSESGITIVSGLAQGIDAASHKGGLSGKGSTIAVVANGPDMYYPAVNRNLQKEIENKGLVISEYSDGVVARKHYFPVRNRIISALSEAVVVVEAEVRSGSIITAEAAIEQGREVYAVPGNFTFRSSSGTNHLILDGARPVLDLNTFLREMGIDDNEGRLPLDKLSEREREVYEAISGKGEVTVPEICFEIKRDPGEVTGIVTILEMKGFVETSMGKVFASMKSF